MCRIREREARRSRIVWSHEQGDSPECNNAGFRKARSAEKPVSTEKEINIMMNAGDIAFPFRHLPGECSQKLSVFGFEIAFYGLIIGIGVLAGILMAVHQAKVTGENPDTIWDFAIYAVIFSVIGARIYYVVFAWDYYKDNLLSIFNTRNGGMAIYGGVIGAFLTLLIYCRIKKINPFRLGDLCVPGLILGQIIGRWGNFMNREVFGEYTDSFWPCGFLLKLCAAGIFLRM